MIKEFITLISGVILLAFALMVAGVIYVLFRVFTTK